MSVLRTLRSVLTPSRPVPAVRVPDDAAARGARLEALYRAHSDRIFGLCLRMSGDRARATELAQDVFVRAWEKLDQLAPDSDAGAWLWRLAVNVVLNARRSDRRRWARVQSAADAALLESPVDQTPLPVRRLSLDAAIARLPERARAVYVLHDVEGYSHEEIATMLSVAEGTVRAHLHRARTLMRETLR